MATASYSTVIHFTTELRHLPRQNISELGHILQIGNAWSDIMGFVPNSPWVPEDEIPPGTKYSRKYSSEEIDLVAQECLREGRTGFEVLVEEWGTSGRKRPKIIDLINLLNKAGFERASLYLQNIINGNDSKENTCNHTVSEFVGIANAPKEIETTACPNNDEIDDPYSSYASETVKKVPYDDITLAVKTGTNIGEGAFGTVYKSFLRINENLEPFAIKILMQSHDVLKNEILFKNEIEILSKCNHKNIIKLEGYSAHDKELALVYSYMENGSLFERISKDPSCLPWKLRLKIAIGIAEAIVYLHTNFSPPMIHRDVKSANVLLDTNYIPKLGDFGIVRPGGRGVSTSTAVKTTAIGTQMYMAPEAFRGDVSVKTDTFSFAIVVLELLTGLLYYDENRENSDILSHVQELEDHVLDLLDSTAGEWDITVAQKLFEFTEICTSEKRERPNMVSALEKLNAIIDCT